MNPDGSWKRGVPLWQWGDSSFSLYPIMMFLGILTGFLTVCYFWKRQKYPWEILQIILIIAVPSAILGARLWYALFNPEVWNQFFHFSGLAIQGGIIFSFLGVGTYLYFVRHVIDVRTAVGILIPAIFIGQTIGRIGNFANHEVYGQVVDEASLNWLQWIGIKSHMFIDRQYRAPFFLYEMFGTLAGYILVVWVLLYRNWVRPGVTAALYVGIYGVIRLTMEPLRDEADIIKFGDLQISTLISALMIVISCGLFVWWQFLTRPFPSWVTKIVSPRLLKHFIQQYQLITPIKLRRKYVWVGSKVATRYKYTFFGKRVANHVRIWIPNPKISKWSKRELNAGKRQTKRK